MLKKLYVKMRQQLRDGNKINTSKEQWLKENLPQASLMQMLVSIRIDGERRIAFKVNVNSHVT